jgi:hypothetical protein
MNIQHKNIHTISEFLLYLKKSKFHLWFSIEFVFNSIYKNYTLTNILDSEVFGNKYIYLQKLNNKIGIMCYLLCINGYVSNSNIFNNFLF